MADGTHIEWARHPITGKGATWQIVTGCDIVSPGCTNCYAMKLAGTRLRNHPSREGLTRPSKAGPVWTGEARFNEKWLTQPLKWRDPRGIFVAAHGDLFADGITDDQLDRIFAVMALCSQHIFMVLTKRPERMREYIRRVDEEPERHTVVRVAKAMTGLPMINGDWTWPLPNVLLGVSVEDQTRADERIPILLDTPAAVRFISAEPLLGPIDLESAWHGETAIGGECWGECAWCEAGHPPLHNCQRGKGDREKSYSGLDWVIAGGESGRDARPSHPDWFRQLRDQCAAADIAFFFKQWGAWGTDTGPLASGDPIMDGKVTCAYWDEGRWHFAPDGYTPPADAGEGEWLYRLGKNLSGRELDGHEHTAFPEICK